MRSARLLLVTLFLAACAPWQATRQPTTSSDSDGAPPRPPDLSNVKDAVPRDEPRSRYGNPPFYEIKGQRYYVMDSAENHQERGIASWYGTKFHGKRTSSGEPYDMYAMTAAHKTLPLPSYVEIVNLRNNRKAIVKVNDRGPFAKNRIIDLSYAAAARLDMLEEGTAPVEIRVITAKNTAPSPAVEPTLAGTVEAKVDYYLQIGAFSDRINAERLRQRLLGLNLDTPANTVETALPQGRLFRVRVGPIPTIASVDRLTSTLTRQGITDALVVIEK
jgi:rare lipoprotein A